MALLRIWPATDGPAVTTADTDNYTLGVEFRVSQDAEATAVYLWRPGSSPETTFTVGIYRIDGPTTGTLLGSVAGNVAPANANGWIRVPLDAPIPLIALQAYRAVAFSTTDNFYSATGGYWTGAGPGGSGITNGILTAVNTTEAANGAQGSFIATSVLAFPNTGFNATNYWVDVEVDDGAGEPISVNSASVTLQGQQPTLSGSGETSHSTGAGGLTLAGQQPTLSGEGAAVVAVDEGGYALAGQQPTLEGSGATEIPVDTAILNLSGVQPALAGDITLVSVDTAVLALEGQQTVLSTDTLPIEVPVDPAILVLSGQQTAISGETTLVAVQPAVLDIFGVQAFLFDASVPPLPDDDVLLVLRVTNGDVILALSTGPDRDLEMR